jgi:hypothetical protein
MLLILLDKLPLLYIMCGLLSVLQSREYEWPSLYERLPECPFAASKSQEPPKSGEDERSRNLANCDECERADNGKAP